MELEVSFITNYLICQKYSVYIYIFWKCCRCTCKPVLASFLLSSSRFAIFHPDGLFFYGSEGYFPPPPSSGMKERGGEQNRHGDVFFPAIASCNLAKSFRKCDPFPVLVSTSTSHFHRVRVFHSFTITAAVTRKEMSSALQFGELKVKRRGKEKTWNIELRVLSRFDRGWEVKLQRCREMGLFFSW